MFNWFRRSPKQPSRDALRESFFADRSLERFAEALKPVGLTPPWSFFRSAADFQARGDRTAAAAALRQVLGTPDLESRIYLQAWKALHDLGEAPDPLDAPRVLGMVIDVGLEGGLDTLAAFSDGSARYINQSGKIIIWDTRLPEVTALIDALLEVGERLVGRTRLSGRRLAPPSEGRMRLYVLTPGGTHTVESALNALSAHPPAGEALERGARLMQALIERAR